MILHMKHTSGALRTLLPNGLENDSELSLSLDWYKSLCRQC